jgi:ParB family transcriptional regulator, chromosome partitioning protein
MKGVLPLLKGETEMETNDKTISNVRVAVVSNRAHTEWINVEDIVPNPLNPRKDDSVKTEELQHIIKKRGWEMPITCYKKGNIYVVLSGHRRLYAARAAKIRQMPVFIVEAPKTHQEEVERIASAQLASEDWTSLEWSRFTYERWLAWGKPGMKDFSKEINLPVKTCESYIRVMEFFPLSEIESGLSQKIYSMRGLYDLVYWSKRLKAKFPKLVEYMSEDMIRRIMLEKVANKKASSESLRKKEFLEKVKESDIKRFLTSKELHLEELMAEYEFNVKERSFHAQTVSIGHARKAVKNFSPKNTEEAKKAYALLKSVEESLKLQIGYIERKYPSVDMKNDLFDWEKK